MRVALCLFWMGCWTLTAVAEPPPPPPTSMRIVDGSETTSWPAVGALISLPDRSTGCTATLVGCQTALIAAHCLCAQEECTAQGPLVPASSLGFALQYGPAVGIDSYDVHPDFSDKTQVNDVAVLHLDQPIPGVLPAAVNQIQKPAFGSRGTTLGYGITGETDEESAGLKREGQYSSVDCALEGLPNESRLCWLFAPGDSGICSGDSGGPDFVDLGGVTVLAGLHTAASGCSVGAVGLSQDVFFFRQWIVDHVGADLAAVCPGLPWIGQPQTEVEAFTDDVAAGPAVHSVVVDPSTDVLRFNLNADETLGSDLDLLVKMGSAPSAGDFDCESAQAGSFESCEIASPGAGVWFAAVTRLTGLTNRYQLVVSQYDTDAIFLDGFESGDTSAWSSSQGRAEEKPPTH